MDSYPQIERCMKHQQVTAGLTFDERLALGLISRGDETIVYQPDLAISQEWIYDYIPFGVDVIPGGQDG
jgi:hypothetical protein